MDNISAISERPEAVLPSVDVDRLSITRSHPIRLRPPHLQSVTVGNLNGVGCHIVGPARTLEWPATVLLMPVGPLCTNVVQ
jgi:hypothetical protein